MKTFLLLLAVVFYGNGGDTLNLPIDQTIKFTATNSPPWLTIHPNNKESVYYPSTTTMETKHKPIVTESNGVWIIRFKPK